MRIIVKDLCPQSLSVTKQNRLRRRLKVSEVDEVGEIAAKVLVFTLGGFEL